MSDISDRTRAVVEDHLNDQWENMISKWDTLTHGVESPVIRGTDVTVMNHLITDLGKAIINAQSAHRDLITGLEKEIEERMFELAADASQPPLNSQEQDCCGPLPHGGFTFVPHGVEQRSVGSARIQTPRLMLTEQRAVVRVYVDRLDLICRVIFERGRSPIVEQQGERTALGDHNWLKVADAAHEALAISHALAQRLEDALLANGTQKMVDAAARLGAFYGGSSPSPMDGVTPVTPSVHSIHKPGA